MALWFEFLASGCPWTCDAANSGEACGKARLYDYDTVPNKFPDASVTAHTPGLHEKVFHGILSGRNVANGKHLEEAKRDYSSSACHFLLKLAEFC